MQIYENDFDKIKNNYKIRDKNDLKRLKIRTKCVWNWLQRYAPEDLKFHVQKEVKVKLNDKEKEAIKKLLDYLEKQKKLDEKLLYQEFYNISKSMNRIDFLPQESGRMSIC